MNIRPRGISRLVGLFGLLALLAVFLSPFFSHHPPVLLDLAKAPWEICVPAVSGGVAEPCKLTEPVKVPSDAPALVRSKGFDGWLLYKTKFQSPEACISLSGACSLVIGEVGDAAEAILNGVAVGRHGDFPPNAVYAKNYGVKFELSRNLLKPTKQGENELDILVYSLKRTQTGLTRGPIAIMPSAAAFAFVRSVNVSTVVIPIFESVVLIFVAIMGVMLLRYHKIEDELSTWFIFYCFAAALFLLSISETTREFLPIALSGWSHFFLRTVFDYAHFALVACYFFPSSRMRNKIGLAYAVPILGLLLGGLASLGGRSQFSYQSGFDMAHAIMRYSAPLVFLPVGLGLWGSTRTTNESKLALLVYAVLVPAQLFDILVFHGVIRGLYFCKFYPMPLGVAFAYLLTRKYQLEHEAISQVEEAKNQTNRAIASLTGMLAHDVRKPFSILRMGLGMLRNAKDPASVKKVLGRIVPEIDKAVSSVDGLIADVMEVGSTSAQLIQEPASPESLIEATLGETFRIYPKAEIAITYNLHHLHMVNAHVHKVGRVFSNIVGNAVQAMGQKGTLWFKTRERDGLIEFCLGNAGSCIPPESLPKLFDAFFTSGKKGGTGLGLAIAEKVIKAHGGRIWCESSKTLEHPDGKVEFFFTLPVSDGQLCKSTAKLARHSSEIINAFLSMTTATDVEETSVDKSELTLEADIIQASEHMGRPLNVLVVDDEAIYRSALASYLGQTPELRQTIVVVTVANSTHALAAAVPHGFDLVITDVDMGPAFLDGFELVREFRAKGMKALICMHSNRIVAADHQTAFAAGADAFLPKPVARAQLLRLLLQAAERGKGQEMAKASSAAVRCPQVATTPAKPELLLIDDNPFVLDAWVDVLSPDAKVHIATSMASLEALLAKDAELVNRLALVVTDFHLDDGVADGADIGRKLKSYKVDLQVLLSSDGNYEVKEFGGAIDRVIGKNPAPLRVLMNRGAEAALH